MPSGKASEWPLLALNAQTDRTGYCRLLAQSGQRWIFGPDGLSACDAVDGARSAASECYSVVALKREQFKEVRPLPGSGRDDMELKF